MAFTASAHAKYILSGEHSVLREGRAVVFPIPSMELKIKYEPGSGGLDVSVNGSDKDSLVLVFCGVIEQSMRLLGIKNHGLKGKIAIENNIPLGRGLGFSAALCVAVARLFVFLDVISEPDIVVFATRLEDYFHGSSSGVDVLGAISNIGVCVLGRDKYTNIDKSWSPRLYLMCSGRISRTSDCVKKVNELVSYNPLLAKEVDRDMCVAIDLALSGLKENKNLGFKHLSESISLSQSCFKRWGLVPDEVENKINHMHSHGAEAVKITGAGDGGFLLGLWKERPDSLILNNLIPV